MKRNLQAEETTRPIGVTRNPRACVSQQLTLAGVEIDSRLLRRFADSFRAFQVDVHTVANGSLAGLEHASITACLLPLHGAAVKALRKSEWFSPRHTLIYAIGDRSKAAEFRELGINALLATTTDLSLRAAIASTRSVIARGIGECARVPMVIPVTIGADGSLLKGLTSNVGDGGMALRLARNCSLPNEVTLDFSLPDLGPLLLTASPRWYSGLLVGLRFQPSKNETALKKWVRQYSLLGCAT